MSVNTWFQRLELECLRANWNHVALAIEGQRYFLNLPIVFDNSLATGVIHLEPNVDAIDKAKRSSTTQA